MRLLLISGSFSAAQKALKVPNRSSEGTKWLMTLLDALEEVSFSHHHPTPYVEHLSY